MESRVILVIPDILRYQRILAQRLFVQMKLDSASAVSFVLEIEHSVADCGRG